MNIYIVLIIAIIVSITALAAVAIVYIQEQYKANIESKRLELQREAIKQGAKGNLIENFAATLTEKHIIFNTFIAHPVECNYQWNKLKACIEQFPGYNVFPDNDSRGRSDVEYCRANICSSSLIIILVDNCDRFLDSKGIFWDEIKLISDEGLASGKRTYICSYGTENPLVDAIGKDGYDNIKPTLEKLKKAKNHCFANSNIEELASLVINAYKQR